MEDPTLAALRRSQSGVLTRRQIRAAGCTDEMIWAAVRAGRWRRLHRGVYWTYSGPPPRRAMLWAAVLHAGRGAVISHESAAELAGLIDKPASVIHVSVPLDRRVESTATVRIHRRQPAPTPQPARAPARTSVEDTVIDLTQTASTVDDALGWLARACAKRLTTTGRLVRTIGGRARLRWRNALVAGLADILAGCHSVLEMRYLNQVERAHGLPTGTRQRRRREGDEITYSDVEYEQYALVVELDGRIPHEGAQALRDRHRDNRRAAGGDRTLRYGWIDVYHRPCQTAGQTAEALRTGGWAGTPTRCGQHCAITDA